MEKYVDFKLVNVKDSRIYLNGIIDINSIDDIGGSDWEFEQNDGLMGNHIPNYWRVDGEDLSDDFQAFIDGIDWIMLEQYLVDFQDDAPVEVDFYGNKLVII